MRNKLLASTAALLAGIAFASAQNMPSGGQSGGAAQTQGGAAGQDRQQGRSGQTQQGAQDQSKQQGAQDQKQDQNKQGQSQRSQGQQRDQTTGQAPQSEQSKQGQRDQGGMQGQSKQGQSKQGQRDQSMPGQSKQGQSQQRGQGERDQTTGQTQRDQSQSPAQSQRGQRDQTQGQAPQRQQGQSQQGQSQQGQSQQGQSQQGQSQQGQAGGNVTLTSEQRTRIQQTVLAGRNVPRVDNVNFSLSVGTAVPSRVRIVDVPPTLIEIYPQWRGHQYFVVRDEIVIVDRSRKVVAVVPVGSSGGGAARLDSTRGAAPPQGDVAVLNLAPDEIRQVQMVLKQKGFFRGEPDGVLGPRTTQALIAFQRQQGFEASGRIDSRTVTALGMSNLSGQQSNQGGSQPSTTGQGGDATQQPPAAQDRGAGQQGSQDGNQPSTSGQGGDRMQSPPNQDRGAAQQGNPGGNQPSTTGQGGDRMQQPPAGRDAGGQSGSRETPQDSSPNKESR
jgi:hypothetical protein